MKNQITEERATAIGQIGGYEGGYTAGKWAGAITGMVAAAAVAGPVFVPCVIGVAIGYAAGGQLGSISGSWGGEIKAKNRIRIDDGASITELYDLAYAHGKEDGAVAGAAAGAGTQFILPIVQNIVVGQIVHVLESFSNNNSGQTPDSGQTTGLRSIAGSLGDEIAINNNSSVTINDFDTNDDSIGLAGTDSIYDSE